MSRVAWVSVWVCLGGPLACNGASSSSPQPEEALVEAEPLIDRRPLVGERPAGVDLTEHARQQNAPGLEPPLPNEQGKVTRAQVRPEARKTSNGFAAYLPGASSIPTPAYHQGHVIAGGFGTHQLHALDSRTGKPAWSIELSDDGPTPLACEDGVCVFNTYSCTLYSVAADTGKHLWSWWLGSPQLATPIISGGLVYTSYPQRSGPEDAPFVVAAFRLATGEPVWRRWIDAEVNSTPVAYGGRIFVATSAGTLYELGASDGKVVDVRHNRVASAPVIAAGKAFYPRDVTPNENDMLATAHPVWPGLENQVGPPHDVKQRPRPLVVAHRLVEIEAGVVVASNKDTGVPLWQRRLENDNVADVVAPLLFAGNSVLLATAKGDVVRLTADTGDVMQTFSLGEALSSPPIVHAGWIYAGTAGGSLVGYDTGAPELTGWEMLGGGPERQGVAMEGS